MKAIVTVKKYDLNGNPYMLAKSEGKRALRVAWDDSLNRDANHEAAMRAQVARMDALSHGSWSTGHEYLNGSKHAIWVKYEWKPGGLPDGKSVCWVAVPVPVPA